MTYPLQRTGRVVPARCPARVLLQRIPFGQTPSLHPLRHRLPGVVRRLLRYYGSVRLPMLVHHRRMSSDFPTRPGATIPPGEHGTSRFPRKVFPRVHGVSDRAGFPCASRYRRTGCRLPLSPTASASRSNCLSRLNTRPARPPVHASTLPLRTAPQDSGPLWVANPSTYDSFIHYTLPVLTGARENRKYQPTAQVMMDGSKWRHLNKGGRGLRTKASCQDRVSPIPALQHFQEINAWVDEAKMVA